MALAVAMLKRWRKQSETMERLQKKKEEVDSSVENNGAPEFAVINLRSGPAPVSGFLPPLPPETPMDPLSI